jgi:PAS domain S-box-containing protein
MEYAFIKLFSMIGVSAVLGLSIWVHMRHHQAYFANWVKGIACNLAVAVLDLSGNLAGDGRVIFALGSLALSANGYFFFASSSDLQWRAIPRWVLPGALACGGLGVILNVLGQPMSTAVALPVLFNCASFIWLGATFLRLSTPTGRASAPWLAVPLIVKGAWVMLYPVMGRTPSLASTGYFVDGLLLLFIAIGMVVFMLERSSRELKLLIDGNEKQALVLLGLRGTIASWNAGAQSLFGFSEGEVMGQDLSRILACEAFAAAIERGAGLQRTGWQARRDGSRFWARQSFAPITLGRNKLAGFSLLTEDISDLREAEEERARLASAIEQLAEAVVIVDREGYVRYANPAFERLGGVPVSSAIGQRLSSMTPTDQADEAWELGRALESDQAWSGRLHRCGPDGQGAYEDVSVSPIRDSIGAITYWVIVRRDVTREVRLQAELAHAQKMEDVGKLASGIAHDFGNLLMIILGYNRILKPLAETDEVCARSVAAISRATERGSILIRQLLAFSRKDVVWPQVVDINELAEQAVEMLQRLVGEEVRLELETFREPCWVKIDSNQLKQIFVNLVVNARDAMGDRGKVAIATRRLEAGDLLDSQSNSAVPLVELTVKDEGTGMSRETLKRIFEPFFTTKPPGEGTGMGLAVVDGIVRSAGGSIRVQSELGRGSTFFVRFPICESLRAERPDPAQRFATNAMGTILLVEDERPLRLVFEQILRKEGYSVLAPETADALKAAKSHPEPIDLLLTELVMPDANSLELARELKSTRPDVRVLFMSDTGEESWLARSDWISGSAFLQKPLEPDELLAEVRDMLATRTQAF